MPNTESHINKLNQDAKKSMLSRVLVALGIALVVLPLVFVGDYGFFALVLFTLGVAGYEIISAGDAKFKSSIAAKIISYVTLFLPLLVTLIFNNLISDQNVYNLYFGFSNFNFIFLAVTVILILNFALAIFDQNYTMEQAFYYITMEILLVCGTHALLFLRYYPIYEMFGNSNFKEPLSYEMMFSNKTFMFSTSTSLLLFVCLGAMFNDIFAYFFGVLFGKHKMCPRISPKKTWEGFVGGIFGSAVLTFGIAIALAYLNRPIIARFDIEHWYLIAVASICIPFIGTLGDLIFSLIKRHFGVKDFGTILQSHGGILDRLDSIYVTTIVGALIVSLASTF